MNYLLIEIGCIECGDPTYIGTVVNEVPEGYKVVKQNSEVKVNYSEGSLAIELGV